MITTVETQSQEMSTVEALWVLFQRQSKRVRSALTKRILADHEKSLKKTKTFAQEQMERTV